MATGCGVFLTPNLRSNFIALIDLMLRNFSASPNADSLQPTPSSPPPPSTARIGENETQRLRCPWQEVEFSLTCESGESVMDAQPAPQPGRQKRPRVAEENRKRAVRA